MITRDQLSSAIKALNIAEVRPRKVLIEKFVRSMTSEKEAKKILTDLKSYPDFMARTDLDGPQAGNG